MATESTRAGAARNGPAKPGGTLEADIYDKRYANYDDRQAIWEVLAKEYFQRFLDRNDTVLDIATGYGWFINHVEARRRIALDVNPDAKAYLAPDVEFLLGSSTRIGLSDATVDKIYVGNLFEHLTRPDILATIREFHRVLKPGGKVLVLQPNIRFLPHDYWMFFDHITPIDDRALDEAFGLCGFDLAMKELKFLPHSNSGGTGGRFPLGALIMRTYLKMRFVWRFLGKSSFMIYAKR